MDQKLDSQFWKDHFGLLERAKNLEDNVSKLWTKWDSMQKMVVGILVGLILNLIGLAFLISMNGPK